MSVQDLTTTAENLEKESNQPGMRLQNSKMLKIELNGECMARTGSMVAYQGQIQFQALGSGDVFFRGKLKDYNNTHPGVGHAELKDLTDGTPTTLHKHTLGLYSGYPTRDRWTFHHDGEQVTIYMSAALLTNSVRNSSDAAINLLRSEEPPVVTLDTPDE